MIIHSLQDKMMTKKVDLFCISLNSVGSSDIFTFVYYKCTNYLLNKLILKVTGYINCCCRGLCLYRMIIY